METNDNQTKEVETTQEFALNRVLTFYDAMEVLVNQYKIHAACAPFFFDFLKILEVTDPAGYKSIWTDSDIVSAWETKELIGPEKIFLKGDVPVFTETLVHAIAGSIKKHEELFAEFAKHGYISFLEANFCVRGIMGKDFQGYESRDQGETT
jgi:hypothetical protein